MQQLERVGADVGDEHDPPGQADDLDSGPGDAEPGDPTTGRSAGEAPEEDADRSEQRGADDEHEEPAR